MASNIGGKEEMQQLKEKEDKFPQISLRINSELEACDLPDEVKIELPDPQCIYKFKVKIDLEDADESLWCGAQYSFDVEIPSCYPND